MQSRQTVDGQFSHAVYNKINTQGIEVDREAPDPTEISAPGKREG